MVKGIDGWVEYEIKIWLKFFKLWEYRNGEIKTFKLNFGVLEFGEIFWVWKK